MWAVRCAISKMEDFAGFCGQTCPNHAWIVLNTLITTNSQSVWRPSQALSCVLTAILDPKIRKQGIKLVDKLSIDRGRHLKGSSKCVKVRELELLTEPQTEQPRYINIWFWPTLDMCRMRPPSSTDSAPAYFFAKPPDIDDSRDVKGLSVSVWQPGWEIIFDSSRIWTSQAPLLKVSTDLSVNS